MSIALDLETGMVELGLDLAPEQQQQLLDFLILLSRWNKTYNLTAIRDLHQMVSIHLLDSLAIIPHLWCGRWLDVGCGAGLPGLVMAVARPDWEIVLLDSNSKKTSFVQQAIIALKLKNARVYCSRIEEFRSVDRFDGVISRAFADLESFLRITNPFLAATGRWVAMKGDAKKELFEVSNKYRIERTLQLDVPRLDAIRSLVIVAQNERKPNG